MQGCGKGANTYPALRRRGDRPACSMTHTLLCYQVVLIQEQLSKNRIIVELDSNGNGNIAVEKQQKHASVLLRHTHTAGSLVSTFV